MPVYAKDRKETNIQYVVTAQKLQIATVRFVMNDKRVPKKWRYMLAQDIVNKVSELVDNVVGANTIFPNTEEKLDGRKKYLQRAIINAYQLENKLNALVRILETVTPNNLKEIISLLSDEIALLKKTHQNAKVVGQKEV